MCDPCVSVESLSLSDHYDSPPQRQPPESSEYDTDLEIIDSSKSFRGVTYQKRYLQACEMVGVVPASYFLRNVESDRMDMNHHGLGPNGARAIAIALVSNTFITHLSLKDNWIQDEGLADLAEMLRENNYIQELNLSNNQLQFRGSEVFCKMLLENVTLQVVKLSGNGFKDASAKHFSDALSVNFKLQELDLSHNAFCESGGVYLGQMLGGVAPVTLLLNSGAGSKKVVLLTVFVRVVHAVLEAWPQAVYGGMW
ncbi:hypothetical protein NDU88_002097 [Pleurodeles waltl]|uniref:Uncharacterized protein n=1 Tax=Pleurodeles waltl TaxID=8319 RepID=A0AAV7MRS4_PLEWA|nr:hypothetical protein NDU88_002097 [Pleurodeles waltl]